MKLSEVGDSSQPMKLSQVSETPSPKLGIGDVASEIVGGGLSNLESILRGTVAGVPAIVGIPGEIQQALYQRANAIAQKRGEPVPYPEGTSMPTASGIYSGMLDIMPRITPTRQETEGMEMLGSLYSPSKAPDAALGALRVLGRGIKGGETIGREVGGFVGRARGTEANKQAEALRKELKAKTDIAAETGYKGVKEATSEQKRLAKAQQQLAGRGTVAEQRAAQREADIQSSLKNLSTQTATADESVGRVIQKLGESNVGRIESATNIESIMNLKEPALVDGRARYAQKDFIQTNPNSADAFKNVISVIDQEIAKLPKGADRKPLESLKNEVLGRTDQGLTPEQIWANEQLAKTGKPPAFGEPAEPLSLDQAEFLRRKLNDKDWKAQSGFATYGGRVSGDISEALQKAMNAYEPRMGDYVSRYSKGMMQKERALLGRGEALTEREANLFKAEPKSVANYYLDGTRERAMRLVQLSGGKTPELVNAIRADFKAKLEGLNAKQTTDFIKQNQGLLQVFPELKPALGQVEMSRTVAERSIEKATEGATAAEKRLAAGQIQAGSTLTKKQAMYNKYAPLYNKVSSPETTPKEAYQISQSIADKLFEDDLINKKTHALYTDRIRRIENLYGDQAIAKQQLKRLGYVSGGMALTGAGSAALGRFVVPKALGVE
jgi:hypothetical protein